MISYKILKDPTNESFKDELDNATSILTINEAHSFFDIILGHFNKPLKQETGRLILNCIRRLIRNDDFRNVFIENQFIDRLPFTQGQLASQLYDMMYDIAILNPDALDSNLCPLFGQLFAYQPEKALTIIGYVSKNLKKFENPWPILDLLFYESKNFSNEVTGSNYVTLLAYLCNERKDFANARSNHCYKCVYSILITTDNIEIRKKCYDSLRVIQKFYTDVGIPVASVIRDISNTNLQIHVLSYLISLPREHSDFQAEELIQCLVKTAKTTSKSTAVLLKAAQNRSNARLIMKQIDWKSMNLPTLQSTLQLFLVIFGHKTLRKSLMSDEQSFAEFLCRLVASGQSGVLIVITMVLRRVEIDETLLQLLQETGFLHSFIVTAKNLEDEISMHSCILLVSTLAKVGFQPSFVEAAHIVAELARKKVYLSAMSCHVAADLNAFPKCREVFGEYRLEEFFRKKVNDKKIGKVARRFLKNCE